MDNYTKIEKIGEGNCFFFCFSKKRLLIYLTGLSVGTYGVVYKGRDKGTNVLVALKKVRINDDQGIPATTLREVCALKELQHRRIVRLVSPIFCSRFAVEKVYLDLFLELTLLCERWLDWLIDWLTAMFSTHQSVDWLIDWLIFSLLLEIFLRLVESLTEIGKLYLVFEYIDHDMRRYMDTIKEGDIIPREVTKVKAWRFSFHNISVLLYAHFHASCLFFSELYVPDDWGHQLLPFPAHHSPRSQAAEYSRVQGRANQNRRLWPGPGLLRAHADHHSRGNPFPSYEMGFPATFFPSMRIFLSNFFFRLSLCGIVRRRCCWGRRTARTAWVWTCGVSGAFSRSSGRSIPSLRATRRSTSVSKFFREFSPMGRTSVHTSRMFFPI